MKITKHTSHTLDAKEGHLISMPDGTILGASIFFASTDSKDNYIEVEEPISVTEGMPIEESVKPTDSTEWVDITDDTDK